jgi:uncharacterized protein
MYRLPMELRGVDEDGRTLEGVVVPYDEVSYLTPNPAGERVLRGAFAKSAKQRAGRVFLFRGHDHGHPVGRATTFSDEPDGLHGTFQLRASVLGDETLADVKEGYLPGMSVGFRPLQTRRGSAGETEVVEAQLLEVSLVALGAYDSARVLALREASGVTPPPVLLGPPPPVMPGWIY